MYLIIGEAYGDIEEKNGNKYLIFVSADKYKKVLKKYTKLWDEIKYLIKKINGDKAGEYEKECMKIIFNSDDNSCLNKMLKLHNLTIVFRSAFQEDGKYYPQVFFMNVCMNCKC